MKTDYMTINIRKALGEDLKTLAAKVKKREGLSSVSLPSLIERMKKSYEEANKL